MTTIKRFEEIQPWQKARVLTAKVYKITAHGAFAKDYALRDQLRRAAVSIMLNIAEGYARRTSKEFVYFLSNAHGSAAEVQSALYIALDCGYITENNFSTLYAATEEVSKLIAGFTSYLKRSHPC